VIQPDNQGVGLGIQYEGDNFQPLFIVDVPIVQPQCVFINSKNIRVSVADSQSEWLDKVENRLTDGVPSFDKEGLAEETKVHRSGLAFCQSNGYGNRFSHRTAWKSQGSRNPHCRGDLTAILW
jgi:hypothetical protein